MKPYWDRLWWNIWHIVTLRWTAINPYVAAGEGDLKPKNRTPWEDITHSIENIYKEWRRIRLKEKADEQGKGSGTDSISTDERRG